MSKPTFNVYVTEETDLTSEVEKKTYWTKVGVAFRHKEKPGLNILLTHGIAVSGKLVLLEPKEEAVSAQAE
ncbi:hypothetical protein [Candidatus Williamhamiltonella defendens]|uniref:hypothetical protein n=1 Tax=Candidatus Williamhamiltonella defendens TaxID=138072 RepID=UPI0002D56A8C|nr:hypothetical protein [Candidatus Hamiltonella defensa]CED78964.1 Conserved hypothetical protein [Candidatus Hamiltonella defensa (Bemisia tabaci)]